MATIDLKQITPNFNPAQFARANESAIDNFNKSIQGIQSTFDTIDSKRDEAAIEAFNARLAAINNPDKLADINLAQEARGSRLKQSLMQDMVSQRDDALYSQANKEYERERLSKSRQELEEDEQFAPVLEQTKSMMFDASPDQLGSITQQILQNNPDLPAKYVNQIKELQQTFRTGKLENQLSEIRLKDTIEERNKRQFNDTNREAFFSNYDKLGNNKDITWAQREQYIINDANFRNLPASEQRMLLEDERERYSDPNYAQDPDKQREFGRKLGEASSVLNYGKTRLERDYQYKNSMPIDSSEGFIKMNADVTNAIKQYNPDLTSTWGAGVAGEQIFNVIKDINKVGIEAEGLGKLGPNEIHDTDVTAAIVNLHEKNNAIFTEGIPGADYKEKIMKEIYNTAKRRIEATEEYNSKLDRINFLQEQIAKGQYSEEAKKEVAKLEAELFSEKTKNAITDNNSNENIRPKKDARMAESKSIEARLKQQQQAFKDNLTPFK